MHIRELHNNIGVLIGTVPVAVGTTGTGQVGKVIDRRGYRGVEFIIGYGAITATNATFTVIVKEGDVTGTMTSVADADLLGLEANCGIAAGTPRTSGTNKSLYKRIGYKGLKRYVSCLVKSTITAGTPVSVAALGVGANIVPVAT